MATCDVNVLIAEAVKMQPLSEKQLAEVKTSLMCSLANNEQEVAVFQANVQSAQGN